MSAAHRICLALGAFAVGASGVLARDNDRELRSVLRSFFESPRTVYLNRGLQASPARLKFDIASHPNHSLSAK